MSLALPHGKIHCSWNIYKYAAAHHGWLIIMGKTIFIIKHTARFDVSSHSQAKAKTPCFFATQQHKICNMLRFLVLGCGFEV